MPCSIMRGIHARLARLPAWPNSIKPLPCRDVRLGTRVAELVFDSSSVPGVASNPGLPTRRRGRPGDEPSCCASGGCARSFASAISVSDRSNQFESVPISRAPTSGSIRPLLATPRRLPRKARCKWLFSARTRGQWQVHGVDQRWLDNGWTSPEQARSQFEQRSAAPSPPPAKPNSSAASPVIRTRHLSPPLPRH